MREEREGERKGAEGGRRKGKSLSAGTEGKESPFQWNKNCAISLRTPCSDHSHRCCPWDGYQQRFLDDCWRGGVRSPLQPPRCLWGFFFKASPACDFFLNPMVFRWRKKKRDMTVKMQHHWWVCSSCLAHGRTHPHFLCRRGAGRGVCDLCVRSASPCHNLRLNALLRTLNGKA